MSKEKQLLEKKIENLILIKPQDPAIKININNIQWIDLTKFIDVVDLYEFVSNNSKEVITVKIGENKDVHNMFSTLITKIQNQITDNEINPLYIACDFICGKDKHTDSIIRAPIHFVPVRIRFIKKNIVIEKFQNIKLENDKLFFFLRQKKIANNRKTFVEEMMKYSRVELPLAEVECDYNFKRCDGFVLGIYELCDTFFYDITKSIASKSPDLFKTKTKMTKDKISLMELSDRDIVQITPNPLNIYQRRALISAMHQDTIIYGPPGTGKSEAITNFIATILNQNKTAIIVSEKNAALQVIKERLGELSDFCFFADTTLTKKDFYNRIKKIGELINFSERSKWVIKKPVFFENDKSKKVLLNNIEKNIDFYHSTSSDGIDIVKYFELISNFSQHQFLKVSLENMKSKARLKLIELSELIHNLELNSDFDFKELFEIIIKIKNDLKFVNFDLKDKLSITKAHTNAEKLNSILDDKQTIYVKENWSTIHAELVAINFLLKDFNPYCDDFKNILDNATIMNNFKKGYEQAGRKEDKFIINFLKVNGFDIKKLKIEKTFGLNELGQKIKRSLVAFVSSPLLNSKNSNNILTNADFFSQLSCFLFKHPYFEEESIQRCLKMDFNHFIDDEKILNYIVANNITKQELVTLISLIDFEKEVLNRAKANNLPISDNALYNQYYLALKQSQDSIITIMKSKLIENLQYKISKIKNSNMASQIENIFQLSNLDKKIDIDKFISTYKDGLLELFDIWLGRPDQLTHYLYPSKKTFDYSIFDEASQMYMERAIAILNKTSIKIIAGDDKQLKPSNWFETRYSISEFDTINADSATSVLERAKVAMWPEFTLKYHYRSRSYELIKFSNSEFYNNELEYASWNNETTQAIEVYDVQGFVEDGKNQIEAQKVVEILNERHKLYQRIIVITFGLKQADLINAQILKSSHNILKEKMIDGTILITNLENVQGNEADLVIISNTYGKNNQMKAMTNHFGSLIQNGGKNRLNVALTRAKEKMIIVKSFKASEMAWNRDNENAVSYFRWIEFLDNYKIQKKNPAIVESDKWKSVELFLKNKLEQNFKVQSGYTVGSKVFDFFITNSKNNKNIGIEIVGLKYFASTLNMIEDFETHLFLKNRNYQCLFINELDWYTNPIRIINEIKVKIDEPNKLRLTTTTQ